MFSGLTLCQHMGILQCSAVCFSGSFFLCHVEIILSRLAVVLTGMGGFDCLHSWVYLVTNCFPSLTASLQLQLCHIKNTKQEGVLLGCWEIHVSIGHGLQQVVEELLCLEVMLFSVKWCKVLTKDKLDEVYVQVSATVKPLHWIDWSQSA